MPDEELEALGNYFVKFFIRETFKMTFEQFIGKVRSGKWEVYL